MLAQTAGIVDTGTTLILIASGTCTSSRALIPERGLTVLCADAFATYQTLTGGTPDEATGLLSITPAQFANLQSLFFNIGGVRILTFVIVICEVLMYGLADRIRAHA